MPLHQILRVRKFSIEFHVYVDSPDSPQKIQSLAPYFDRLPDEHLAVLFPFFIMERKPGGRNGGGTWSPREAAAAFNTSGQFDRTKISLQEVQTRIIQPRSGVMGMSKDRWQRDSSKLPFTVFHEVAHCIHIALGGLAVNDGNYIGISTENCGHPDLQVRRAIEVYSRFICKPNHIYNTLPPEESSRSVNQRLMDLLFQSPAFRTVSPAWRAAVGESVSGSRHQVVSATGDTGVTAGVAAGASVAAAPIRTASGASSAGGALLQRGGERTPRR